MAGGYCNGGTPVLSNTATSVAVTDSSVRNYDAIGVNLTTTSSVIVKTSTVAPVYVMAPLGSIPNCVYANAPTVQVSSNTVGGCGTGGAGAIVFQNNSITDAAVGVNGTTGNTVTGNTYKTVTTLTQP